MKKRVLMSLLTSSVMFAGGYKIPEVSTNGVALGAANVAHVHSADAAYYNPANMVFMEDKQNIEADLIYIGLDSVHYDGKVQNDDTTYSIDSEKETFIIPNLHYVSPKLGENDVRIGMSVVVPGGLSKRWSDQPAKVRAQEFTLEVVELNPTLAIPIGDKVAFAFGFRIVSTSGVVKSSGNIGRDMTGDSVDMGYNLALAYKPTKKLEFGATYRSRVNLTVTGTAKLYDPTGLVYDGGANVTVPLPAFATLAAAYTFDTQTTIEVLYERNMWSAYQTLDFNYVGSVGNLAPYFDEPHAKDWKDTNTYRVGLTQELDKWTVMAGFVKDETPVPDSSLSFELPGTDTISVSMGTRYQYNDSINIGFSALYSMHDERTVDNEDLSGTFSDGNVLIVSVGLGYRF